MTNTQRVGLGYDIHRLVEGRPLILGGITIDFPKGLLGHSDGDVVLHAITDALLGAAGLGDIGEHFPDTDPAYKDVDSVALLKDVLTKIHDADYRIINIDINIHAERPKLKPHKPAIRNRIANLLDLPPDRVNVKAKTNERLGPIGLEEGIACTTIALLVLGCV